MFGIFKSEFIRHSSFLFLGSAVALILSLVFYPVFSRIYSPGQFGVFALFTSITGVVAIFASGVYEQAILLPKKDIHAISLVILSFGITMLQCLVFLIIALFFRNYIANRFLNTPQIAPFLLLVPLSVLLTNMYAILTGYSNRKKYFHYISQSSVNQGIVVNSSKLLFGLLKYTNYGLVFGRITGQLSSTIQLIYQVFKKTKLSVGEFKLAATDLRKVACKYKNFPVYGMPHQLLNALSTALPVFVLSKYFTTQDAGQYSMAAGILLTPVVLFTGSVSKVLYQHIVEGINKQVTAADELFKWLRILMPVTGLFFVLFFFVSQKVFVFFLGQEWQEAAIISGILLPWIFMVLFTSPINFIPDIFFKQRKALFIDIIYLLLRLLSLAIGVYYNNAILAIFLFVISGCLVLTYNFIWYLSLLKNYNRKAGM